MPGGAIANLSATLRWDMDDFQRGTAHIEGAFKNIIGIADRMAAAVANAGRRMTLGLTLPIGALSVLTTKAASDAAELQSAFDFTFGNMSSQMNRWAENTGDAMGRATQEMQEGALAFGQLFNAAAPNEAAAARLSQQFTELAQDAASFYNTDFDTAMGKIRSGLTGEAEPLRDFGVFLNEAAVKAKGLELGLVSAGEEMNEYGKVMARAAVIAEGLNAAQGDVERTSSSLANRIRKIKGDIQELATEIGQYLEPYAQKLAGAVEYLVEKFKNLPEGVKKAMVGFGLFLAVLGPLSLALSGLAIVALPLFLVKLGGIFPIISLVINPIGTLFVMLGKLITELGGVGAVLSRVLPLFLRLLGPVGAVITLFMLFGDSIAAGLKKFGDAVSEAVGPRIQEMFARIGEIAGNVRAALDDLAQSEVGQFFAWLTKELGKFVEFYFQFWGTMFGQAVAGAIDVLNGFLEFLSGMVDFARDLFSGNWQGAWDTAVDVVGRAMIRIGNWISNMFPLLGNFLSMLGRITGAKLTTPAVLSDTDGDGAFGGLQGQKDAIAKVGGSGEQSGGRDYAMPDDAKVKRPRTGRGRSGPTAEALADRREEIRLQQALAIAREKGDLDQVRALERKRDIQDRIERYERAGLDRAQSRLAAEKDLLELDEARAIARAKELATHERSIDMDLAELRGDYAQLTVLEDEEFLERRLLDYQRMGLELAEAEKLAKEDLLHLEDARADATSRRLADEQQAHEFELARLRGDDDAKLRAMDEDARRRARAEELFRSGDMNEADARAQALREGAERSQAYLQGSFRDAFRNGLQAAMNGDLKGFFEGWLQERSFNALSRVLDKLADSLANLISGSSGGGGGILGAIGSVLGIASSSSSSSGSSPFGAILNTTGKATPGFATGGSFKVSGYPGIDKNLLSLNGNPIARVSSGEIMDIRKGETGGGGSSELAIRLGPGLEAEWLRKSAGQTVQIVSAAAPGMLNTASSKARRDAARPVMPGGATG